MSELIPENPEELLKTVHINIQQNTPTVIRSVRSASVIPIPIDPTLTHQGEAADAYATGQAIANVWDGATVNGKAPVNKAFTVYATEMLMSSEQGAQNVAQAIENANGRTANDIMYDAENLTTVAGAIDGIKSDMGGEISEAEIDEIFEEVFGGDE